MYLIVPKTSHDCVSNFNASPVYSSFAIYQSSNCNDFSAPDGSMFCVTKAPTLGSAGEISMVGLNLKDTDAYKPSATYSVGGYTYKLVSVAYKACFVNKSIKSLDLSDATNLTMIEPSAFDQCFNLANVNLGSTVTSIGKYSFCHAAITGITIPKSVTFCSGAALWLCNDLASIVVEDGNTKYQSMGGILYEAIDEQPQSLRLLKCPGGYPNEALYEYMFPKNLIEIAQDAF